MLQAVNAAAGDTADEASQGDAMSTVSLSDIPMARALSSPATASAIDPALLPGHADAAWGQDNVEAADELQFMLSSNFSGRLPTVVEHMEEGMSRPQSLADLSKAGWTVDSALSRCSSHTSVGRLARISSFPELGTMPEGTLSSGGSPQSGFPEYPSQRQLADLGAKMSSAFSGISNPAVTSQLAPKATTSLNPHAVSFQPGRAQAPEEKPNATATVAKAAARGSGSTEPAVSVGVSVRLPQLKSEVVVGFAPAQDASMTSGSGPRHPLDVLHESVSYNTDALGVPASSTTGAPAVSSGVTDERADKAVARRLLLKKRVPSFNKSKSCNDLVSEPRSPTRSPFAPLAHLAQ